MLFSNEGMFKVFAETDVPSLIKDIGAFGYRLKILCFVRNPLEHAVSSYQQAIKRAAETGSLGAFLETYARPREVYQLMAACERLGIDATFVNYSTHKADVLGVAERWLGLPTGLLEVPRSKTINRSLTAAELELQRVFNIHLGKRSAQMISDPLCNALQDIASELPPLSRADLAVFLDRMAQMIAAPNAQYLQGDAYHLPALAEVAEMFSDPDNAPLLGFSPAQLDVIAKHISNMIQRIEKAKAGG